MNRSEVLARLDQRVLEMLDELEAAIDLSIEFRPLAESSDRVRAQYFFDSGANVPRILLRGDFLAVDVAHELIHPRLELVEGFGVLALRQGMQWGDGDEKAVNCVRTYVDDEIVFRRLAERGFKIDGEILTPTLFEDLYSKVPDRLKQRATDDGMAHLDSVGWGGLRRSAFLVQAELILRNYADNLSNTHRKRATRFVQAFRRYRSAQAKKADYVLGLFEDHDVLTQQGHDTILSWWAEAEGLPRVVGLSSYTKENGTYRLPWP